MPKVSILVPVYKAEKTLDACVESILAQTFPDFELLLIDDESPDRCPEMCDAWAKKDPRIRAFQPVDSVLVLLHVLRVPCRGIDLLGLLEQRFQRRHGHLVEVSEQFIPQSGIFQLLHGEVGQPFFQGTFRLLDGCVYLRPVGGSPPTGEIGHVLVVFLLQLQPSG